MVKCTVEQNRMGHLTVTFENGKSLYLQSDYDVASFGVNCGFLPAPNDWDGQPSSLPEEWSCEDFDSIEECPEEYEEIAE